MAIVEANFSININQIDLNWYLQNFRAAFFYNNSYQTHFGNVYQDSYEIHGRNFYDDLGLGIAGSGFTVNGNGAITGGTAHAMAEFFWPNGQDIWGAWDFSVPAADIYNAAKTPSNADDLQLLQTILSGDDTITMSNGPDLWHGYDGNDQMRGNKGNDTLFGDGGKDTLRGGDGSDLLRGGAGADTLYGNDGPDALIGGAAKDILTGNAGHDYFVFNSINDSAVGANRDVVADFQHGDDLIDVSAIDANENNAGNQSFHFIGSANFTGAAGELRFSGGIVAGDVTGDGVADFEIGVAGIGSMTGGDFIL